jgi:hypothetical protein
LNKNRNLYPCHFVRLYEVALCSNSSRTSLSCMRPHHCTCTP